MGGCQTASHRQIHSGSGSLGPQPGDRIVCLAESDPRRSVRFQSRAGEGAKAPRPSSRDAPAICGIGRTGRDRSRRKGPGAWLTAPGSAFSPHPGYGPGAATGRKRVSPAIACSQNVRRSAQISLVVAFTVRQKAGHFEHLLAQPRIQNGEVGADEITRFPARHQVCDVPLSFVGWHRPPSRLNPSHSVGIAVEISKEPCDRNPQLLSDLVQARGADAGLAGFIFLHQLGASSEPLSQVVLAQVQQNPPQSHPSADVLVHQVRLLGKNAIGLFLPWF